MGKVEEVKSCHVAWKYRSLLISQVSADRFTKTNASFTIYAEKPRICLLTIIVKQSIENIMSILPQS